MEQELLIGSLVFTPRFSGVQFFPWVLFCKSWFVLFFLPLNCTMSFVDLQLLITSLVSSKFSWGCRLEVYIFRWFLVGFTVTRSLVLCVCVVDHCLTFRSLCCLFFDLRILMTSLVSSNSSYHDLHYGYHRNNSTFKHLTWFLL